MVNNRKQSPERAVLVAAGFEDHNEYPPHKGLRMTCRGDFIFGLASGIRLSPIIGACPVQLGANPFGVAPVKPDRMRLAIGLG